MGATLGDGLGGLEVGQLDLDGLAEGPAGADDDVARLDVEVDAAAPLDVVQGVQDLRGDLGDHLLGVGGLLGQVADHIGAGQGVEQQHAHFVRLVGFTQANL